MATNIELKVEINDLELIKTKLKQIDAHFKGTLNQKDIYFENKIGLLKLRMENGQNYLIQYLREEEIKERISSYEILNISDPEAEIFLKRIFKVECEVEKKRQLYIFKNTRIHLDDVKNLGIFLELETVVNDSKEKAIREFNRVITLLGLNPNEQIRKSYRYLIEKK